MTGDTRWMWGISLVTVPTIIYGGLTVLGVAAVASVLLVSGGFFASAHAAGLRAILYAGALSLIVVVLTVGIGLVRAR